MKKILTVLIISMTVISFNDYAQHHQDDQMDHTNQNTVNKMTMYKVDKKFSEQLTQVYNENLELKNAFVKSDPERVTMAASKVEKALDAVDMGLLDHQSHIDWMKDYNIIKSRLNAIKKSNKIDIQRRYFADLNEALHHSINSFGVNIGQIYYQYCPMALNNEGAYWLSDTREIMNPYYGEKMLKCGSTKEIIN